MTCNLGQRKVDQLDHKYHENTNTCMYLHLKLLQNRTQKVSSKKSLKRPLEKSVNKCAWVGADKA